jgi:uncharacterized membrane protein
MATIALDDQNLRTASRASLARWSPVTGIAFAVLFIAGVVASNPPGDGASSATWIADYTGTANRAGHVVTGVCLVLAGLCLVSFVTAIWQRVVDASRQLRVSPLPLVTAGIAAACMAVGGALMGGAISVVHSGVAPDAGLLRFCNDVGFVMVGLAAMLATALCVATLTYQAARAGVFGRKLAISGYLVAVVLLASLAFVPIIALLLWCVVVAIVLLRRSTVVS